MQELDLRGLNKYMNIKKEEILCIIPARAGSKGIKNKNIKKLNSKRLIDYSIETASQVFPAENIFISTDSEQIAKRSLNYDIPIPKLRPAELANDKSLTIDVVLHTINELDINPRAICLLQPTSPFRTSNDIEQCIEIINSGCFTSVISVNRIDEPHPNKMKKIKNKLLIPYVKGSNSSVPRQSLEELYSLNGCIYLTKTDTIIKHMNFFGNAPAPYVMNQLQSVNINSELDWILAEKILEDGLIEL